MNKQIKKIFTEIENKLLIINNNFFVINNKINTLFTKNEEYDEKIKYIIKHQIDIQNKISNLENDMLAFDDEDKILPAEIYNPETVLLQFH